MSAARWEDGAVPEIIVIDNYDSFVYNLVQYLQQLGANVTVWRNDKATVDDVAAAQPDGVLLSPGPGVPADAGISEDLIRWAADTSTPLLGVCLGHQAIAEVFGGRVDRSPQLMHGKTSQVEHFGDPLYTGLPHPFTATRYHSLSVVEGTLGSDVAVTARTVDGPIMGIRHTRHPICGVQFHPESVLSEGGHRLLANYLAECGYDVPPGLVASLQADVDRLRVRA